MWKYKKCLMIGMVFVTIIACSADALLGLGPVKQVDCPGTVVDASGRPVADAEVVGYEQLYDYAAGRTSWAEPSRMTTGKDGRFMLKISAERKDYIWLVAYKKGLALGWQSIRFGQSEQDMIVRLGDPAALAGTVVDEAGHGISGAIVRLRLKMGWMGGTPGVTFETPQDWFTTKTDSKGCFRFDHVPTGATADFWVEAPGKASCWTYWQHELSSVAGTQFQAGQTDILIIPKPEGILRGKVVNEDSGEGIAGVRLLARPDTRYANYSCVPPVTSGPDGTFIYTGLAANDYSLQVVAPYRHLADWVGKDVKVTVETGQTTVVNIPVSKGGLVEVTILDAVTEKPIENANAGVSLPANFGLHPCWFNSVPTNTDGIARLRVPPGELQLRTWAEAYDYFTDPEPVIIAKGETIRREVSLVTYPVVTGIVRDPGGQPVAGAIVSSKPVCEEAVRTDEQGRFKVTWRPSGSIREVLILARDIERNLAGLEEVEDQAQSLDVALSPAFVVRGIITDPNGHAIAAARVALQASMPGWGTDAAPAVLTDTNGRYEICAVPAPTEDFQYRIEVSSEGFGPAEHRELPFDTAQDRQVRVSAIILTPADKSISGVIVDPNGTPVAGIPIFITGPRGSNTAGQPRQQSSSDEHGRFSVDGVCVGPLRIQAGFGSRPGGAGFLDANGGDRDVEVVLGRRGVHTGLKPLLGKPLPEWKEMIHIKPEQVQNKILLFCFFDFQQRPSRRTILQLAKQTESLEQKGIIVAAVQAMKIENDKLHAWAKDNKLSFPVGAISDDVEKIRNAWGVKALPWLILTNHQHVITAEGFGLDELDAKIEKLKPTTNTPADTNKVTGLVKDSQGRPLSSVRVTEFQTNKDYTTDADGKFISTFGPSNKPRSFFVVDKQHKLVGIGRLPAGERHVEIKLAPGEIVSGTVVDSDGKPVSSAQVAPLPMTCFHVLTDKQGQFDVAWSPSWEPREALDLCLMVRRVNLNLAALADITEDTENIKIKLSPALTLTGIVEDPNGKPISGAKTSVSLIRGSWGCGTPVKETITNNQGRFELYCLPQKQEYGVQARAEGFWRNQIKTGIINSITDREEVGPIILKRPILTVTGVVVYASGKVVANIPVHLRGDGQPYLDSTTDANGNFVFEKVCCGPIRISAKNDALFGKIETEGGAKDVKVVVHPRFE